MAGLKEVAEAAGVSVRTVKRALTGEGAVGEDTRQKVLKTARRLEYRPNLAARSLKTGASSDIAVLMHSVDELHMEKLLGLEGVLRAAGYSAHVLFSLSATEETHVTEMLLARRSAGAVLFPATAERWRNTLALIREKSLPYMALDTRQTEVANAVRIDRAQGVEEAVRHLAACGRRRIAYIGSLSDRSRLDGYERALAALGLSPIIVEAPSGPDRERETDAAVRALLKQRPCPDAIQAYSDVLAMDLLRTLHGCSVRIPQDIAVVGFDNRSFAALACPPLTTVAQPGREVGAEAGKLLLRQIGGDAPPEQGWTATLPTRLIVRKSA